MAHALLQNSASGGQALLLANAVPLLEEAEGGLEKSAVREAGEVRREGPHDQDVAVEAVRTVLQVWLVVSVVSCEAPCRF